MEIDISKYRVIGEERGMSDALAAFTADFGTDSVNLFNELFNVELPGSTTLPGDVTLNQSKYDFKKFVYPSDIGLKNSYNGHYMVININVSDYSNFSNGPITGGKLGAGGRGVSVSKLSSELSKVDSLRANIDKTYVVSGTPLGVTAFVPRRTRRIKESIAIYMPNTMVFSNRNSYEDVGLTDLAFRAVQTGVGLVSSTAREAISSAKGILSTVAAIRQQPINPRIEVIFSTSQLRQFQFDFMMSPSSYEESIAIENIIKALRFHQAPEYNPITSVVEAPKALLWTPPSEFDITFFNRGKENTSIPRINTCVLESVDVDFAPSGIWSTFSNGKPVQIRMTLGFKEVEINHKLRILQGF